MPKVPLQDGTAIEVAIHGSGPAVLLPVGPQPSAETPDGRTDPAEGNPLVEGLRDEFRVVVFDYEGHLGRHPRPDTLTPGNITADLLAIANAARADRFAYYGYSWLGMSGLQLAIRTRRLSALVIGGFPPIDGPYAQALRATERAYEATVSGEPEEGTGEPRARQFVTLYESLQGFDDRAIQAQVTCPRLCFVGATDEVPYGQRAGVPLDVGAVVRSRRSELEAFGWDVRILDGLDPTEAAQPAHVLRLLRPWLTAALADDSSPPANDR
ncbi:alpha/beta fold hydrolase [Micromonospora sp. NBC_01796]|uniref:alpha/beta fold hydrolase n=1 Tax=Micromonospora sp. NBC_01796 TaxID=2975987 RepID=UPI002DDB70C6|nr:alpha/beta hydrolase [Micromonospora sp. NBC_01796]WSA84761.1 alpha/beta hydrolase [Micromonospora sp. NBC_01796]